MKAIVLNGTNATVVCSQPIPKLRDDYLLVKTVAVALNPTDCKAISQGRGAKDGLAGCDFAGIVEEIGPAVTKRWNKGDRVCGCTHGANSRDPDDGSFAEFIVVKGDVCMRIPDGMSFEEAAGIGVSAITCGQGLFQRLGLNLPLNPIQKKEYILIYGGSTSAGTLAIQYAKLAGYSVLTTCSPRNVDLVRSRGAEAVFDYNDPSCGEQIHRYTKGELQLVWDTIGSDQGVQACMAALSTKPGCRYGTILLNDIPRQDVACTWSIMMTFRGEPFDLYGKHFPASAEDFEFAKMFTQLTETLLAENKLKPHPIRICEGGLQGVLDGVGLVQQGNVSGVKLVYRVADTP
ncbi:chaperonin 10-like protein [Aspergillus parasiticus]|uniref:Chaperonin 10-like protein n=1 Tax=Aspergillus parasiticus TaxID=5067 RepID=A0A5N6DZ87_ASPPA|nr:chaperonin 10-like protein [Aspergillus parasiticus]